jgi:multicomponent K+:H+ antiporter subunit A
MPLLALLLMPVVSGTLAALRPTAARNRAAGLAGLTALGGLVGVALHFPSVRKGGRVVERIAWVPPWARRWAPGA